MLHVELKHVICKRQQILSEESEFWCDLMFSVKDLILFPGLVRAGCRLRWFGSELRRHSDRHVSVGCQAECRGGEHGKVLVLSLLLLEHTVG